MAESIKLIGLLPTAIEEVRPTLEKIRPELLVRSLSFWRFLLFPLRDLMRMAVLRFHVDGGGKWADPGCRA